MLVKDVDGQQRSINSDIVRHTKNQQIDGHVDRYAFSDSVDVTHIAAARTA